MSKGYCSSSISTVMRGNLHDVFGENDPTRRRAASDEIFTEDCVFQEPQSGRLSLRIRDLGGIAGHCFHLDDLLVVPHVVQRDVKQPLVGIQSIEDRKRMLRVGSFKGSCVS